MTAATRNTPTTDDLDDLPEEVQPKPSKQAEPQWNGRRTRIRLEHPVLRGTPDAPAGRFLDGATPCIDCGQPGHAFHAAASKGSDGVWRGPEAEHIRLIQDGGYIAGSPEARARQDRQRRRDELIGPEASPVLSAADLEHMWRFEMRDGVVNTEIESGLRRDEAEQLRRAVRAGMSDVAEVIREVMAERTSK